MSKARTLADLLDSNGDVVSGALDNVPPSNDASALTTGTLPIARIADGDVTTAKLASTLDLSGKTVTLPDGSVSNYSQNKSTSLGTTTSTTYTDIITTSITPSSTNSKILVMAHGLVNGASATSYRVWYGLFRNTSTTLIESREETSVSLGNHIVNLFWIDEPNTTSSVTYNFRTKLHIGGTVMWADYGSVSITAMEIAA